MSFTMTRHALKRGVEMALDAPTIRDTLYRPESVRPAKRGMVARQRGRVAAIVNPGTGEVLTLVYAVPGGFDRGDIALCRDEP